MSSVYLAYFLQVLVDHGYQAALTPEGNIIVQDSVICANGRGGHWIEHVPVLLRSTSEVCQFLQIHPWVNSDFASSLNFSVVSD